ERRVRALRVEVRLDREAALAEEAVGLGDLHGEGPVRARQDVAQLGRGRRAELDAPPRDRPAEGVAEDDDGVDLLADEAGPLVEEELERRRRSGLVAHEDARGAERLLLARLLDALDLEVDRA